MPFQLDRARGGGGDGPATPAVQALKRAIANNEVLIKKNADAIEEGGSGSALTIQDEGSGLETAASALNFTGAGVTASGTSAEKVINIPGSKILQVLQNISTAQQNITYSLDHTYISNLDTNITLASASNKVLVSLTVMYGAADGRSADISLFRTEYSDSGFSTQTSHDQVCRGASTSDSMATGILAKGYTAGSAYSHRTFTLTRTFLDTPSEKYVRYRPSIRMIRNTTNGLRVNRDWTEESDYNGVRSTCNIVLQEVAS